MQEIKYVNINEIKPDPNNPRLIKDDQFKKLCQSIKDNKEYFETRPILCDKNMVIFAGNMRYKAAKELGIKEVPVSVFDISEEKRNELMIRDNVSNGEWDFDILANQFEVKELEEFGLELKDLKMSCFEGEQKDAEPQIDKADELNEHWKVKTGDLWQIGEHKLLCGDSTKEADVGAVMGQERAVLMVTDPPYGVNYDADWRNRADRANGKPYGARAIGVVENDDRADWFDAFRLFSGDVIYCWHASASAIQFANDIMKAGFEIKNQIIWAKNNIVIGRGDYHWKHEPCWYAVRVGKNHNWQGSRKESTVWEIDKPMKSETGHSTQKPLECMAIPIRNNTAIGELVYDPFVGSGTTMVACQNLNRKCRAIEISPSYCAVILQRMVDAFPDIKINRIN